MLIYESHVHAGEKSSNIKIILRLTVTEAQCMLISIFHSLNPCVGKNKALIHCDFVVPSKSNILIINMLIIIYDCHFITIQTLD